MKLTKERAGGTSTPSQREERSSRSARHARLILLLAEGLTWAEVRAKLDCSDSYISRWSTRFQANRLAGLFARYAGRERYKVTDGWKRACWRGPPSASSDGSTHGPAQAGR